MDTDAFWGVLDEAKLTGRPLAVAVADHLATTSAEGILAFEHRFTRLRDAVYRWDVWAAAHLIGRGCSDDSFDDFTAGLVALGREWYERAAACPDALAEHPSVRTAAAAAKLGVVFAEDFNFVSCKAYERLTGSEDDFWEALEAWEAREVHGSVRASSEADDDEEMGEEETGEEETGEPFDFDDAEQMRRRLPRLAELYLGPEQG